MGGSTEEAQRPSNWLTRLILWVFTRIQQYLMSPRWWYLPHIICCCCNCCCCKYHQIRTTYNSSTSTSKYCCCTGASYSSYDTAGTLQHGQYCCYDTTHETEYFIELNGHFGTIGPRTTKDGRSPSRQGAEEEPLRNRRGWKITFILCFMFVFLFLVSAA